MQWLRQYRNSLGQWALAAIAANILLSMVCCVTPHGNGPAPWATAILCTSDGASPVQMPTGGSGAVPGHACDCLAACMSALALAAIMLSLLSLAPWRQQPRAPLPAQARPVPWRHRPHWGRAPPLSA